MASNKAALWQVTAEMQEEMRGIEAQIQRRIAIGGQVSERRIIDELVRFFLDV